MARIASGRARQLARNLYALLVEAEAHGLEDHIDGLRYPLIVFAKAQDRDSARPAVVDHLVGRGWLKAVVRGVKRVGSGSSELADPILDQAAALAAVEGYAIVADDEPITN
jgi:hypothetical protein